MLWVYGHYKYILLLHSSHHPQEVLLAQFSLYVHKGGLKPDSFYLLYSFSAEIDRGRRNLTSTDVRFLLLKSVPALNRVNELDNYSQNNS